MTRSTRLCDLERLTAEARSALQELREESNREQLNVLLETARQDPVAPYQKKWYPRFVVWELTLACNMRCAHCGSSAGKARSDELTLDEMYQVCDDLGRLDCERVTLLGGEPLIHRHWPKIAERIRKNGYRANVITNGWTLARPKVCDQIAEAGLTIVGISVDGMAQSHDHLRCRPGSFDRIMTGIDLLKERKVPVAVVTVVTNDSLGDLEQMYRMIQQRDIHVWQLQIGNPLGRLGRDHPLIINPDRLPQLFDFIVEKQGIRDGIRLDIADNVGYYGRHEDAGMRQKKANQSAYWTGCHAGIQALGIDSNGDIKGCQSLPSEPRFIEGNVRQRSLVEIWNDPDAFSYTRGFTTDQLSGDCARCSYGPLCKAGCTSAALSHSGDIGDNPMCIQRIEGRLSAD